MTDLDLRSTPQDDRRRTLFEALDEAAPGETLNVVADREVGVLLDHYRIKRGRSLQWEPETRDGDGVAYTVRKGDSLDDVPDFDVRDMPPQRRHEVLTDTFDRLDPGEGFVLVNDHDPKPLYHELRSTRGETFDWEYGSRGPEAWRVEIVKTEATESTDSEVAASFDVREIPKAERHPTIHHRYANIDDGETMEIVAPHEPRPLRREFRQRYGDAFSWAVVEDEPGRCRVRITKGDAASEDEESETESLDVTAELDVRDRPPAERHERIFGAYADLGEGEAFVLVNDHDPKPLYHQFEAEAGDEFRWEYRQRDPGEFRVLIGKGDGTATKPRGSERPSAPF